MDTNTTTRRAPRRRNRVTGLDAVGVAVAACGAAVGAALTDAHPTGWPISDRIVTGAAVAFAVWCAATAPWWIVSITAAVATLTAGDVGWIVAAAAAFVVATWIGSQALSLPVGRAASAAVALNALLRWHADPAWLSAVVVGSLAVALVVLGVRRRLRYVRQRVWLGVRIAGAAAGIAIIGGVLAAAPAVGELRDGERTLRSAMASFQDGDIPTAVDRLRESETYIADAERTLHQPWAAPALVVPGVGQQLHALRALSREAHQLAEQVAVSAEQIDLDSLRIVAGVIDLSSIEVLAVPFQDTHRQLVQVAEQLDTVRSPWLLPPLGSRLDDFRVEVAGLVTQTDRAETALRLAPTMLGSEGPRTYFVAFITPAEARGLGGFMGSWAEVHVDDGRVEVVQRGSTTDLALAMGEGATRPTLTGPAEFLARYGRFGAGVDGAPVTGDFWSNITMSPDFPTVTDVIAQLYPASGGRPIDGAIALDVDTIARLLGLTGPIEVAGPNGPIQLTDVNAADYLLRAQYADISDDNVRDAILDEITGALLSEVFGGSLPAPRAMATTIGPALASSRLQLWSLHPEEQSGLSELGISGELPHVAVDGLAVVSNNAGANKLDTYLRRSISYEARVAGDQLEALVTVRLSNDAPPGLPADVGGNPFRLPEGTNRTYLSIYSPWEYAGAEVDGVARGLEVERESGWNVFSTFLDVPPGADVEVTLRLFGALPDGSEGYELQVRGQPTVLPDVVRVAVDGDDGTLERHAPLVGWDELRASS